MIREMRAKGMRVKDIAAKLDVHPRTVSRALKRGGPPAGRRPTRRQSKLDPFKPAVDAWLAEGVWNATVLLRRLRAQGYTGGISILRDYIRPKRALATARQRATVRYETGPGEQLQHDWAHRRLVIGGVRQRVSLAVNLLGYSRAFHGYFAAHADAEHTYESLVRAFEYFDGVPGEVLVDNQKSAVLGRSTEGMRFNPRFQDLAGHYGFAPKACRVRRPRTKGKVERVIDYVDKSFLAGDPAFEDLDHLNRAFEAWLATTAHERIHGTCQERVADRLKRETTHLGPLPRARFDTAYHSYRTAAWDGYIEVQGNRYSVPDTFCGRVVAIRLTLDGQLQVLNHQGERVAEHRLSDPATGWCLEPHHHRLLWAEALSVEQRDLGVYEEVAS